MSDQELREEITKTIEASLQGGGFQVVVSAISPSDPWERLKKRLDERPLNVGDLHYSREELNERDRED